MCTDNPGKLFNISNPVPKIQKFIGQFEYINYNALAVRISINDGIKMPASGSQLDVNP